MKSEIIDEIANILKTKDNFLITAHINPEGDSIGSQLSVFHILKKLGKKAVMLGDYMVPDSLNFLPGTDLISNKIPGGFNPETAIILDCPVRARVGKVANYLEGLEL
ncbi:MAG: bifunctional oligoribonuclease/PAP phosphatase NrnA, partial [Candidatus Omnitrophota bacterium]